MPGSDPALIQPSCVGRTAASATVAAIGRHGACQAARVDHAKLPSCKLTHAHLLPVGCAVYLQQQLLQPLVAQCGPELLIVCCRSRREETSHAGT